MFIAISFGPRGDKFWNHLTYHSTQRAADRWCLDQLSIAGTFGFVIIKSTAGSWEIVDELGAPSHAVSVTAVGNFFSVQPAPRLALV